MSQYITHRFKNSIEEDTALRASYGEMCNFVALVRFFSTSAYLFTRCPNIDRARLRVTSFTITIEYDNMYTKQLLPQYTHNL